MACHCIRYILHRNSWLKNLRMRLSRLGKSCKRYCSPTFLLNQQTSRKTIQIRNFSGKCAMTVGQECLFTARLQSRYWTKFLNMWAFSSCIHVCSDLRDGNGETLTLRLQCKRNLLLTTQGTGVQGTTNIMRFVTTYVAKRSVRVRKTPRTFLSCSKMRNLSFQKLRLLLMTRQLVKQNPRFMNRVGIRGGFRSF